MYTIEQIYDMIEDVISIYKERQRRKKAPEYRQNYDKEVSMADEQKVHALGKYPHKLFDRKIPNETPEQRDYRKQSFEPATMPYWNKAVQAVQGRVWNDSNYSIAFMDEEVKDYFTQDYPQHGSLVTWFRSVRMPVKLYDANAVQVVMPKSLPMRETEDGMVYDDTEMIEPEAIVYDSKRVIHHDDSHVLILLDEKSKVSYGAGMEKAGLIFILIDDTNIWRIQQTGKKIDYTFEAYLYYTHNLGYVPAQKLQGVPREDDGVTYYNSYFYPAVGDLNTALFDESTLMMAKIANVFPERWEIMETCDTCHGDGQIYDDGETMTCTSCNGTGYNQKAHPLNTIAVKLPDRMDDRPQPPTPPAGYLQKDNDSVRFLREEISRKKEDAFAHLNIDVSASTVNGQTATESKIDREELFSFLLTIAAEEFKALEWTMKAIGQMRYGLDWNINEEVVIDPPTDFTIRSYKELTTEISEANAAGLPSTARQLLLNEYKSTRFSNDATVKAIDDLILKVDRLHDLNADMTTKYVLAGLASKEEAIIHTSVHSFIQQLISERNDFLQLPLQTQMDAIKEKARQAATAMTPNDADILANLGA